MPATSPAASPTAAQPTAREWYSGLTAEQIGPLLTKHKAGLTDISAYVDNDGTVKFAVIMVQGQSTWWYGGQHATDVQRLLLQNKAALTDVSAYIDPSDNTLKFAVIMAQGQSTWCWGRSGADVGQILTQNKARLVAASAYSIPSSSPITINMPTGVGVLNGIATLTVLESGAYTFAGSWSMPSGILGFFEGIPSQDVNLVVTLRDVRGTAFVFSVSGTVPSEGSFPFNIHGTNRALAEHWQFLQSACTWHFECHSNIDLGATLSGILNWFKQNAQTIGEVVQVVGKIALAVG